MKWISVKDQLPEEYVQVLTFDLSPNPLCRHYRLDYIIKFFNEEKPYIWACRLQDEMYNVTHWMLLPDAPAICPTCNNPLEEFEGSYFCDHCKQP